MSLVLGEFPDMVNKISNLLRREPPAAHESVWILLVLNTVSDGVKQFLIG